MDKTRERRGEECSGELINNALIFKLDADRVGVRGHAVYFYADRYRTCQN